MRLPGLPGLVLTTACAAPAGSPTDHADPTPLMLDGDSHFYGGEIGASFVALGLVQLYEEGFLDLDATVESLAPGVTFANVWQVDAPVRVRHLLDHSAGISDGPRGTAVWLHAPPGSSLEESVASTLRRVHWQHGRHMSFSGRGYETAARVLEVVSGQSFDAFICSRRQRPASPCDGARDSERPLLRRRPPRREGSGGGHGAGRAVPCCQRVAARTARPVRGGRKLQDARRLRQSANEPTHPYNIHQILMKHQHLNPGYALVPKTA